jgi:hypothetical protein
MRSGAKLAAAAGRVERTQHLVFYHLVGRNLTGIESSSPLARQR